MQSTSKYRIQKQKIMLQLKVIDHVQKRNDKNVLVRERAVEREVKKECA